MVAPADRGAGACEGMTGHLPGKLLCCCNCNSAATATVANVHRNYARSRHINCQFVEPPMWFSFAPSRLLVLLYWTLPGCLLPPALAYQCRISLCLPHAACTRFSQHIHFFIVVRERELPISQVLWFFERSVLSGT